MKICEFNFSENTVFNQLKCGRNSAVQTCKYPKSTFFRKSDSLHFGLQHEKNAFDFLNSKNKVCLAVRSDFAGISRGGICGETFPRLSEM